MLNVALMILACQVIAPLMAIEPPSLRKIVVTDAKRHAKDTVHYTGSLTHLPPVELPERLVIRGQVEGRGDFTIVIDLEKNDFRSIDWKPLQPRISYGSGSGDIGVAIFGLPGLLLFSPILILVHLVYGAVRVFTGMDQHATSTYYRLRGQLTSEDAERLHAAFLNRAAAV